MHWKLLSNKMDIIMDKLRIRRLKMDLGYILILIEMCMKVGILLYLGTWNNDKKNNYGYEKYADGSYYEGNFKNGAKSGSGIMHYINGSVYEG